MSSQLDLTISEDLRQMNREAADYVPKPVTVAELMQASADWEAGREKGFSEEEVWAALDEIQN
jgi:hypothetical protein